MYVGHVEGQQQLARWAKAVVGALTPEDAEGRKTAIATYRLLAGGAPVSESQISAQAGIPEEQVREILRSWPLVLRDQTDQVVGFWWLHSQQVEPTHAMSFDNTTVFGWCALDTLFIPEILGRTVRVASTDPTSDARIGLTVTADGVVDLDHADTVVSFLLPRRGESFADDAIARFCHQIHFFDSPQSAAEWTADRPGRIFMTVDEAFHLGKEINRIRFGDITDPEAA